MNRILCLVGFHRLAPIGRATVYGKRLLQIVACIHCDAVRIRESKA